MKENDISLFIMGTLYVITGAIFLIVGPEDIFKFIFIVLGILLIIFNGLILLSCLPKIRQDKTYIIILAISIIQIIMGIFVIITESKLLLIITGIILIAFPILAIVTAKNKKEQFKLEITKMSLGCVFIILGATDAARIIFVIIGIISLVFGAIYLIMALLMSIIKDEIDVSNNNLYKNKKQITNYDERDR